jgi:hypothetical protein
MEASPFSNSDSRLVEEWAEASNWTFRIADEHFPVIIGRQDERMRVEVAFFPTTHEAMIELFDVQLARGGILSVVYGDRLTALLDVLSLVRNPMPNMFPSLVRQLLATFHEIYDASDFHLIPVDADYLRRLK